MTAWSWQPDQQTRSAIRRGDKINREYFKRKRVEYELAMIERLVARQGILRGEPR